MLEHVDRYDHLERSRPEWQPGRIRSNLRASKLQVRGHVAKIGPPQEDGREISLRRKMKHRASHREPLHRIRQEQPEHAMTRMAAASRTYDRVLAMPRIVEKSHPRPPAARTSLAARPDKISDPDQVVLLQPPDISERRRRTLVPVTAKNAMQSHGESGGEVCRTVAPRSGVSIARG